MDNSRKYERYRVLKATFYRIGTSEAIYECTILDISRGGMMIVPEIQLHVNDEITIIYPIQNQIFKDRLKILWQRENKSGGEFIESRADRDKVIDEYLKMEK